MYKDQKIYSCIVLNLLVSAIDIDLEQKDLEEKVDKILVKCTLRVTKADIRHEIKSNHNMTNKVLNSLVDDKLIIIIKEDKSYNVAITKKGILHIKKFNEFYSSIYRDQLKDHYRFKGLPLWIKSK